jgi:hypothetical protein
MIRQRFTAAGVALAGTLFFGCRDAPIAPTPSTESLMNSLAPKDTVDEHPGPADITYAYTDVGFYDGSHGGEAFAEISAGMRYIGNKATMNTSYSITGDGYSKQDKIPNQHDGYYIPWLEKRWDEHYRIPTNRNCGLLIDGSTLHQAWWWLFVRGLPGGDSPRETRVSTATPLQILPCEPDSTNNGGGGGSGGGWLTVETCHYWAHYVNGALVDIELRYCEYDLIPVADE